jgi:hypothetical protein
MHRLLIGQRRTPRVPSTAAAFARAAGALVVLGAAALGGCAAAPSTNAAGGGCTADLLAQFSPAIARPTSNAFLQGLVQGTGYDLRYVRMLGTTVLLRLTGPDPTCDGEIARLRRDPSVKSLEIDAKSYLPRVPPRTESR